MTRRSRSTSGSAWIAAVWLAAAMPVVPVAAQGSYGFVARLGRDTVAVERVHRTTNHLSGDVLERNPAVELRHYDAIVALDGSIRRFVVESRPGRLQGGDPASERVTVEFLNDSMRVTVGAGAGAQTKAYPTGGMLAMPWLTSTYATTEQLLLAALRRPGDSIPVMLYLPAGRLAGVLTTWVHRYGADSASVSYLEMPIMAQLDHRGRISSLSGARTTNKVYLTRLDEPPDVTAIAAGFVAAERAMGSVPASWSSRDTARVSLGDGLLMVDYGRPQLRGRSAIGALVPIDSVWRAGANEATQLSTTVPITLAGLRLEAGRYSLWVKLTSQGPTLIVNRETGQWGTDYVAAHDLGQAAMLAEALATPIETFTIRLTPNGTGGGQLIMEWDRFRWTAEIVLR